MEGQEEGIASRKKGEREMRGGGGSDGGRRLPPSHRKPGATIN